MSSPPAPSPPLAQLLDQATEMERSRALSLAATVRIAGSFVYLALALALWKGAGQADLGVYVPVLAIYVTLALVLYFVRRKALSPRISWLAVVVDVGALYVLQREAIEVSDSPAAVAGFSAGIFAVLVALSAMTLRSLAIVLAVSSAVVAEALLMRQAGVHYALAICAAVILALVGVIGHLTVRRLRFLAVDLSQAEVKRQLEHQRRTEVDARKQTIEQMLADAQAHNEQLARLQREKDSLVQLIVHDLRSPLNAVMLSLDFATQEVKDVPEAGELREALAEARSTTIRLSGMVSQILDTAKLEEGRLVLERAPIAARELLDRVRQQLAPMAKSKAVEVRVEAEADLLLRGDPRLFGRVVENLLSNSIRHTPTAGRILLGATRDGSSCRLSVHNSGAPIQQRDREAIFAKFQQGTSDGPRLAGWGLGLYFCRMVVEAHDGTIVVEDVEGWPTSFVVRVPAEAVVAAAAQPPVSSRQSTA
jgi:signal transduction histidine kinase